MSDGTLSVSIDVSAIPPDPRGAGRYTIDLVEALAGREDLELTLISRSADARRWCALAPRASVLAAAPGPRPLRLVWEQVAMPGVLARARPDVHHGPHYTMPERAQLPMVVTVHDLTFFDHPEWHEAVKVPFFRRAIRRAAERADVVVCVSEATARRFRELLHPQARVMVAPHGVDGRRFRPPEAPGVSAGDDAERLEAAGICGPYVAFLGTIEPRKGIELLVEAFDRLAARWPEHSLVLAGGGGWGAASLERAVSRMSHGGRLVRPGYLDDDTVPALLRRADVVVYPARVEGFGLPVIEALACGTPVVTTRGSVMDELAGGAALTFPAGRADALAEVIEAVLQGQAEGYLRRLSGLEIASGYTWAASAAAHVAAYRAAVGRRGPDG